MPYARVRVQVGEVVVAGGVRRSALISLSDLDDDELRVAKSGPWWEHNGQRALSNNSVAYTQRPAMGVFMAEWTALYESKSGERGIFNRAAAEAQVVKVGRRQPGHQWGCAAHFALPRHSVSPRWRTPARSAVGAAQEQSVTQNAHPCVCRFARDLRAGAIRARRSSCARSSSAICRRWWCALATRWTTWPPR